MLRVAVSSRRDIRSLHNYMTASVAVCGGLFSIYVLPLFISGFCVARRKHRKKTPRARFKSHSWSSSISDGGNEELPHSQNSYSLNFLNTPVGAVHIWCAFQLAVYLLIRSTWPILGLTCREKTSAAHLHDIVGMLIRGLTISAFGNIEQRILPLKQNGLEFFGKTLLFLFLYSCMYETCPRASLGNFEIPSFAARALNTIVALMIVCSVYFHVRSASQRGLTFLRVYIGWMVIVVLHLVVAYVIPSVNLHLHHYYWGYLLSHYAIFDTPESEVGQAMFVSFFLHGCTVFGVEPIFYNV